MDILPDGVTEPAKVPFPCECTGSLSVCDATSSTPVPENEGVIVVNAVPLDNVGCDAKVSVHAFVVFIVGFPDVPDSTNITPLVDVPSEDNDTDGVEPVACKFSLVADVITLTPVSVDAAAEPLENVAFMYLAELLNVNS